MQNRLRLIRKERGLTQQKLANQSGVHRTVIARYEIGRNQMSAKNLMRIAHALNVSTDEVLGEGKGDGAAS